MMKEVIQSLETGVAAQIGLIAFLAAFVLILLYTFTLPRRKRDEIKQIPLQDDTPQRPERDT